MSFVSAGGLTFSGPATIDMFLTEPAPGDIVSAPTPRRMGPFRRVQHDASSAMEQRNTLLAQPPEFFRKIFGGRTPTLPEKLSWIEERVRESTAWLVYRNNFYVVVIEMTAPLIHACIRRHDGRPCTDWNDLQQIKSELIGPEHEALELFPAESRLINTTNEYHLWAHPKSGFRFPFGFSSNRLVMDTPAHEESSEAVAGLV
jgi:hypothetical protein